MELIKICVDWYFIYIFIDLRRQPFFIIWWAGESEGKNECDKVMRCSLLTFFGQLFSERAINWIWPIVTDSIYSSKFVQPCLNLNLQQPKHIKFICKVLTSWLDPQWADSCHTRGGGSQCQLRQSNTFMLVSTCLTVNF